MINSRYYLLKEGKIPFVAPCWEEVQFTRTVESLIVAGFACNLFLRRALVVSALFLPVMAIPTQMQKRPGKFLAWIPDNGSAPLTLVFSLAVVVGIVKTLCPWRVLGLMGNKAAHQYQHFDCTSAWGICKAISEQWGFAGKYAALSFPLGNVGRISIFKLF